jgi:DNA-binding XRE family transcriptional regulator
MIRRELRVPPVEMAARMDISRQAYSILENKTSSPTLPMLLKLWQLTRDDLGWSAKRFLEELESE